ncbi:MAG TPA: efflux RND transporter periplasmic adaptor subunit [Albitalea sp.]|nr:efflux RND transporter periplasmic adaptor subunit [Albitalea sp.]
MSEKPNQSPAPAANNGNGRRKRLLLSLGAAFIVAGLGYSVYWWFVGQYHESTEDAYVAGNMVNISPQISATVTAIDADETDLVQQGQALIKLDDTDTAIALDSAKANLADTVRQVRQMFERLNQLRASVTLRQADVVRAKEDLTRREALIAVHAVSNEELQHARTASNTAQAALTAAQHELAAAETLVSGTDVEHHPLVLAAEAKLREAYVEWQRHVVLSPVSGYVAKRSVQLGQRVTPGTPLMTVVPLDQLWVEANFKEDQFSGIRLDQPVTMTADLYGGSTEFHGHVLGVGAGTGAAFALLPPQNASGNWIKIVQRVPVRISLDPRELAERPLRVGLSMKVAIDTHNRGGNILARTPVSGARYQTAVYTEQSAAVDKLIAAIVRANNVRFSASATP